MGDQHSCGLMGDRQNDGLMGDRQIYGLMGDQQNDRLNCVAFNLVLPILLEYARSEVLTLMLLKIEVFWDVTLCCWVNIRSACTLQHLRWLVYIVICFINVLMACFVLYCMGYMCVCVCVCVCVWEWERERESQMKHFKVQKNEDHTMGSPRHGNF
jgi:hypothetical protein